ncbi:MAG: NUDIX hydrolase [Deltaproteobacteria bacterium]|nr:NUDIX hydrolase [Deltaproteobacteria bacterium]
MHRRPLLELLAQYRSLDGDDLRACGRIAEFVRRHDDCFQRALAIGHVTASAWIVDGVRGRVLLTHHRKLDRWLQLGGHVDGSPDVLAAALREAREESGLAEVRAARPDIFDCDVHGIPARDDEAAHDHYDVRFLLEADSRLPLVVSEESNDLAWVAFDAVPRLAPGDRSMLRMLDKTPR